MIILGISAFYHDSSACIVNDGILTAAAQEERFNRIKNCSDFPIQAINFCIQQSNISFADIDYIAYYEQPYIKFHRILLDYIEKFPLSYLTYLKNIPYWLQDKLIIPIIINKELGYKGKILYIPHHYSHAASSYLLSPFEEAGIITADGVGEFATTSIGKGSSNNISIGHQIDYPHSLGLLYSTFTTFLGFKANSGEGTTMALASFGTPDFIETFKSLINIATDGSYILNKKYFPYNKTKRMFSGQMEKLLGKARQPDEEITDRHKAIAATLQYVVEDALIKTAIHVGKTSKSKNLCLAGGVFLNCVANQKILDLPEIDNVFIQPGAGDAGGSIGAAFYVWNCLLKNPKMVDILNHRIKHREWFRPFAPIVKEEKANEYFKMKNLSPFMLLAPEVREDKKTVIPAVTHIDGTARVQTVSKKSNPLLWNLLDRFETKTGVPVLINTSFNLKGEPIVCKPEEAINDYLNSEMDCLVLGNFYIEKKQL
jgi:carbamoyltransferase